MHMLLGVVAAHAPKYFEFSTMGATLHHHAWVNPYYPQSVMYSHNWQFLTHARDKPLEHFPRKEMHIRHHMRHEVIR